MNLKTERPKVNVAELRAVVASRSGGRCEAVVSEQCRETSRKHGAARWATDFHHRKMRSQQGPDTEANYAHVCAHCHLFIHSHPAVSYRMGLLIRGSDSDPVEPYARREIPHSQSSGSAPSVEWPWH